MKKVYNYFFGILLAGLLCVGAVSVFDRDLKPMPDITVSNLLDGSYTKGLVEYYAETFPGRDKMLAFSSEFFLFQNPAGQLSGGNESP